MSVYRVWACKENYYYLDVEADSVDDAMHKAAGASSYIFTPYTEAHDWYLLDEEFVEQVDPDEE